MRATRRSTAAPIRGIRRLSQHRTGSSQHPVHITWALLAAYRASRRFTKSGVAGLWTSKRNPGPRGPGFRWCCSWETKGSASGDGPEAGTHQPDTVEICLFPGVFFGALARLIALVQQLDLLEVLEGFTQQ